MKCLLEAGDKGLMQFQRLLPRTGIRHCDTKFDLTLVLLTDRECNDTSRVTRHRYVMRVAINNRAPLVNGRVSGYSIKSTRPPENLIQVIIIIIIIITIIIDVIVIEALK